MSLKIHKINTRRITQVIRFVKVPRTLYRKSDRWVPGLVFAERGALNRRRNPCYRNCDADFFVAEKDGVTVGRIAVVENRRYNEFQGTKTGFFYYFDAINDHEVARALFGAAEEWSAGRGLEVVLGPKGLAKSDCSGILVEGYDSDPVMGLPFNYPYYEELLEGQGYQKEIDFLSGYLKRKDRLDERFHRIAEKVKARSGFTVKSFKTKRELRAALPQIHEVNNAAFAPVWGFYPIDIAEANLVAEVLLAVADPGLVQVVMKDDQIIGFILSLPDISSALRRSRGYIWPLGWAHMLREFKKTKSVTTCIVALLPEYQGAGANAILYTELEKVCLKGQHDHMNMIMIPETNAKSVADMETMGVNWNKKHRVFRKTL
ncbi:MAG: hypothetical protein HQ559_04170 [Lentisphaerae bacterium]|nr:hypothetical protein [Lentisphaerota bacterium]